MDAPEISKWADAFVSARESGNPKPVLADSFDGATLDDAYRVQKEVVSAFSQTDAISGFKAAVSSKAAQQAQGLDGPLYGVLFKSGEYQMGDSVDSSRFRRCMMETEIGYRVLQQITTVPQSDELQSLVTPIPMLEFAEVGYDDQARMSPMDLVAGNSASSCYLVGEAAGQVPPNDVSVSLSKGDERLYEGRGVDAMGDQWFAVRWIIDKILNEGYVIEAGHYLMTGALGKPQPCKPDDYIADYGSLGRIDFTVT
jgi:2-keto-4-pentenoate hydratase